MPGPKNQKKRNGQTQKRHKRKTAQFEALVRSTTPPPGTDYPEEDLDTSFRALNLETAYVGVVGPKDFIDIHSSVPASHSLNPIISPPLESVTPAISAPYITGAKLPPPSIEDPGSGPRVRDAQAFLCSPFAVRAADVTEAPLCAELAQDEVLLMMKELLPGDLAIMVWYNRTRRSSRICPVCQRLYTLGDSLPDQLATSDHNESLGTRARMGDVGPSPQLAREQALSGLCSPICFALAAYNHPNVVHHVWGASGTRPWRLLACPTRAEEDNGLGLAVRMTRRADLGLGQLLGLQEGDSDETEWEDGGWDEWNALPLSPLGPCETAGKSKSIL